jgi:two-component system, sensor histidine kinase and response regulator
MTLSSYKVLIVDDNPTFVKTLGMLIRSILGEKLSRLDVAYNGKEAVEKATHDDRYNVVFMDVNMPEMDGISATKLINRQLYRETKVVAVSFNNDFDTVNNMLSSGAEAFIYKDKLTMDALEKVFDVRWI